MLTAPWIAIKSGNLTFENGNDIIFKQDGVVPPRLASGGSDWDLADIASEVVPTDFHVFILLYLSWNEVTQAFEYTVEKTPNIADTELIDLKDVEIDDEHKALAGVVFLSNQTGSDFVPWTTALNTANLEVRIIDAYGFVGK